jgi:hypothetical protein
MIRAKLLGWSEGSIPWLEQKPFLSFMYLYGRKEGKIGLFDKRAPNASDFPRRFEIRTKCSVSVAEDVVLSKL